MKKIWTNGCYDILHIGHIRLFKYARSLGDSLIVGIDSDKRVKELKGDSKPFNNERVRKEILLSNRYIDDVFIFDSPEEMCEIVKSQHIHSLVIGEDYRGRHITASDIVEKVVLFPKIPNQSTTRILTYESTHNGI